MADAHGSGPCVLTDVGVQLPPRPRVIAFPCFAGMLRRGGITRHADRGGRAPPKPPTVRSVRLGDVARPGGRAPRIPRGAVGSRRGRGPARGGRALPNPPAVRSVRAGDVAARPGAEPPESLAVRAVRLRGCTCSLAWSWRRTRWRAAGVRGQLSALLRPWPRGHHRRAGRAASLKRSTQVTTPTRTPNIGDLDDSTPRPRVGTTSPRPRRRLRGVR
jgi:hypothetical protein